MWKIQTTKFAIKKHRGYVVGRGGFFYGVECPKSLTLNLGGFRSSTNARLPFPVAGLADALVRMRSVLCALSVLQVLRKGADAKIFAPVIQAVAVDVINDIALACASYQPVQIHTSTAIYPEGILEVVDLLNAPIPVGHQVCIGVVNGNDIPITHRVLSHDSCRLAGGCHVPQRTHPHEHAGVERGIRFEHALRELVADAAPAVADRGNRWVGGMQAASDANGAAVLLDIGLPVGAWGHGKSYAKCVIWKYALRVGRKQMHPRTLGEPQRNADLKP